MILRQESLENAVCLLELEFGLGVVVRGKVEGAQVIPTK
jgi:hypothetical protein